jgi:hypothetical protein
MELGQKNMLCCGDTNISQLEEDFGFICTKFLNQMNAIMVCRETASFALVASHAEIEQRNFNALSSCLRNEDIRNIFKDPTSLVANGQHVSFAKSIAASAVVSSFRTVDSASIVFAHSILEAALIDLLKLTFKASPSDWFHFVDRRKVEISSVANHPVENLLHSLVHDFIQELERESLMRKSDALHTICKPSSTDAKMETYSFSKEKLKSFDDVRHSLVHGQGFRDDISDAAKQLEYASKTGGYFILLVNQRFGFKFSASCSRLVERLKKSNPDCDPTGVLLSVAAIIHKK